MAGQPGRDLSVLRPEAYYASLLRDLRNSWKTVLTQRDGQHIYST
jgi:hypothetical protein